MSFPKDFTWGTAIASYQVEGAWNEDGRGPSIRDVFCEEGTKVYEGHTGRNACQHYHRYKDDIDYHRIDILNRYLIEVRKACEENIPVKGYYLWSFMDNFECAEGYKELFGIVHVDYTTQKRTPEESAYWYRKVIESNGKSL
jgi:beta-glucosidase/6-phospho-beta-glucosidase/beta-galactosidase